MFPCSKYNPAEISRHRLHYVLYCYCTIQNNNNSNMYNYIEISNFVSTLYNSSFARNINQTSHLDMSNVVLISAYVLSLSVVGGGRCLSIKGVFIALLMTRLPFLPDPFLT